MDTLESVFQICALAFFLWIFMVMGNSQNEASEIDCTVNCSCCKNQSCGKGEWFENECKQGCIDGHRGARCYIKCSHDCKQCASIRDRCSECKIGRYGFDCSKNCSVGCAEKRCPLDDGRCKCSDNFWGDLCDKCIRGKYGPLCEKQCPVGCKGYVCDRTSGHCLDGCILTSLSGPKCDHCTEGFYGEFCHRQCSIGCKNKSCQQNTGVCLMGCKDGFNGSKCNRCSRETPEWTGRRICGVQINKYRVSEESTNSFPNVPATILIGCLVVSVVSNIVLVGCLILNRRQRLRKTQSADGAELSHVYENLKDISRPDRPYSTVF